MDQDKPNLPDAQEQRLIEAARQGAAEAIEAAFGGDEVSPLTARPRIPLERAQALSEIALQMARAVESNRVTDGELPVLTNMWLNLCGG